MKSFLCVANVQFEWPRNVKNVSVEIRIEAPNIVEAIKTAEDTLSVLSNPDLSFRYEIKSAF